MGFTEEEGGESEAGTDDEFCDEDIMQEGSDKATEPRAKVCNEDKDKKPLGPSSGEAEAGKSKEEPLEGSEGCPSIPPPGLPSDPLPTNPLMCQPDLKSNLTRIDVS